MKLWCYVGGEAKHQNVDIFTELKGKLATDKKFKSSRFQALALCYSEGLTPLRWPIYFIN